MRILGQQPQCLGGSREHGRKRKAQEAFAKAKAAYDDANLYLRFSWPKPAASGGTKMDAANAVKLAYMLEANKVELAGQSGCWATCHG